MGGTLKWNNKVVTEQVEKQLISKADMAGKYVEDNARKRLLAIQKPDTKRDINYRNYLANYVLTHQVETDNNEIIIQIGMKIGKDGQTHHGFYIETGSATAPAHPYLRPALFQNLDNVKEILTGGD